MMLVTVAVIFDVIQALAELLELIPVVGTAAAFLITKAVDVLALGVFYIWLKSLNVNLSDSKHMSRFAGTFLLEFIPFISALPLWTGWILLTIKTEWGREATQKNSGMKTILGAHSAVGNPNPVSNPNNFSKNAPRFANNLDNLKSNSLPLRDALNDQRGRAA